MKPELLTRKGTPVEKYYASRLIVPAIRVKYEPYLIRLAGVSKHHGSWEFRWRYPWDTIRFPRAGRQPWMSRIGRFSPKP